MRSVPPVEKGGDQERNTELNVVVVFVKFSGLLGAARKRMVTLYLRSIFDNH